jgi:hypothetical protein
MRVRFFSRLCWRVALAAPGSDHHYRVQAGLSFFEFVK